MALKRPSDWVRILASIGVLAALTGAAHAQAPAVVQLPSFSTFGVNTSVSVPDRGSASLGGVGRSSTGSTAFGPGFGPGNRSFGRSTSASRTSVHVTIHDMDALDRETLSRAGGRTGGGKNLTQDGSTAGRLADARQSSAGRVPSGSVAEARKRWAAEAAARETDALQTLKRAREAAAVGKTGAAAVFYRLAARDAGGELKSQIEREAAAVASKPPETRVAQSGRAAAPSPPRGKTSR